MRDTWINLLRRLAPLLPADEFDDLRAFSGLTDLSSDTEHALSGCLQQAISTLDSRHHILTTFLPRYLLDLSPTPSEPQGGLLEGAFIFADVTGFTALTGELSKRGTEGREEMNRLMRSLFAALLDPLLTSGGDLLIFAGDAVLACFPAQPEGRDVDSAIRTALRLVRAIAPFGQLETSYGTFSLTMSAGVERGQAFAAVVGTRQRMEFLVSGGPVQGAMRAEGKAEPGQVFVGPGVLPHLSRDTFVLRNHASGQVVEGLRRGELDDYEVVPPSRRRSRISTIFSRRVPDLINHLGQALDQVETLVPFIPPDLLSQIVGEEDIRQHPPVAVQFVNIEGIEGLALGQGDPERALAVLQRYFVRAQEVIADREGIISQVDAYTRGFTLLNPFGAPTHHEGVPRLAASSALELTRVLERVNREFNLDPPLTQRTGMTYDRIFTGEIGYRHRREYVVAGPAVNLAARLMSKAEAGQIVLDTTAWEAVQEDFVADTLIPIPLKGIPQPVPRFLLRGVRKGKGLHIADHPLVGRKREQAVLGALLEEAFDGRGGALALVGEAGFGKNRLSAAVAAQAHRLGMVVMTGCCRPFAQRTPYLPWAELVRDWFELDDELPVEVRRRQLRERLSQFDLVPSLPAFADLLGLPAPQRSSRVSSSEPRGAGLFSVLQEQTESATTDTQELAALLTQRAARTETSRAEEATPSIWETLKERASISPALHILFERQALYRPTLLVIEDLQWMDPDSREVLEAVVASAHTWPLLLLITTRPGSEWSGDRMILYPLSDDDSRALAALALRAKKLDVDLADWLLVRSSGNPLFIMSYCRALRDADAVVVDVGTGVARWSGPPPALPLSLQELLLAEVDRLDSEAREAARRGAVIGVNFSAWLLTDLCEEVLRPHQLSEALDQTARRSITGPPPPAPDYSYSSQSLHDAVYATLSHATRREWHEQTGDRLAQADEAVRYERLEQIAYHYTRCDNAYKLAHFNRLAGDKARARQADESALAFYGQALGAKDGAKVAVEHRLAYEGIGDIRALRDEIQMAQEAYQSALSGAASSDVAYLQAKLAILSPLVGAGDQGVLEQAAQALPPSDSLKLWLDAAQVWLCAERDVIESAELCRAMLPAAGEPVGSLLREALSGLEDGESLPPYADFFALFARSCLLRPSGDAS